VVVGGTAVVVVVVVASSGGTVVVVVVVVAPGGAIWAARILTIGLEITSPVSLNEPVHDDPVATR
jgi:hypothetical protein